MHGRWVLWRCSVLGWTRVKWSKSVETKASCVVWGSVRSAILWVTSKIVRWGAQNTCREACASLGVVLKCCRWLWWTRRERRCQFVRGEGVLLCTVIWRKRTSLLVRFASSLGWCARPFVHEFVLGTIELGSFKDEDVSRPHLFSLICVGDHSHTLVFLLRPRFCWGSGDARSSRLHPPRLSVVMLSLFWVSGGSTLVARRRRGGSLRLL